MKSKINFSPLKPNIVLTSEERQKLVSFFNLLIEINKRAEGKNKKSKKREPKDSDLIAWVLLLLITILSLNSKNIRLSNFIKFMIDTIVLTLSPDMYSFMFFYFFISLCSPAI